MKKCIICEEEKSIAEFIKLSSGYRHSYCDFCRKEKLKEQSRKRNYKLW